MPRPISATISVSALTHNLATVRRHLDQTAVAQACRRPSGPSSRPMPSHGIEQAVAPRRRGWRCWTWTRRLPRGRLGRSDPAAGGFLRARRPGHRRPLSPEHQRASPRAARHAGAGAPRARWTSCSLNSGMNRLVSARRPIRRPRARPASAAAGRAGLGRQDDPFRLRRWSAGRQRAAGPVHPVTHRFPGAVSVAIPPPRCVSRKSPSVPRPRRTCGGRLPVRRLAFADADAASFRPAACPVAAFRDHRGAGTQAGDSVGYGAIFRAERAASASWLVTPTAIPGTLHRHARHGGRRAHPAGWAGVHGHADGRSGPGARRRRGLAGLARGEDGPSVDEATSCCARWRRVPVIRNPEAATARSRSVFVPRALGEAPVAGAGSALARGVRRARIATQF